MTDRRSKQDIRFKLAIKAAKIGIWEWNIERESVYWSDETKIIFGVDVESFEPSYDSFMKHVHPDDVEYITDRITGALERNEDYIFEHRIIRPNGEIAWLACHGEVIRHENGTPRVLIGAVRDISESKQNALVLLAKEKELEKAHDIAQLASWSWDIKENRFFWSDKMHELFGIPKEEFDGLSETIVRRCVHPDDQQSLFDSQAKIIRDKKQYPLEFRIVSPSGEIRTVWGDGEISLDKNGNVSRMVGTIQDITERKKIENELRDLKNNLEVLVLNRTQELENNKQELILAKQLLEKANDAKSEFLSRMSHELRTPLNAIMGFAQLLQLGDTNDVNENATEILQAAKYLLVLINDVLDLSRIEAGEIDLTITPVNLHEACNSVYNLVAQIAKEKNITFSLNTDGIDDTKILADENRLRQALANLYSNAIKYNNHGGSVDVNIALSNDDHCIVTITDTGIGISQSDLKDLFVPFKRLNTGNPEIEGTGIGLAICKKMIEIMGGEIGVTSQEGIGSSFWFRLPLAESSAHTLEPGGLKNSTIFYAEK